MDLEAASIVWAIKRLRGYLWGTKFRILSDNNAPESIGKVGDHNARVSDDSSLTAFDYILEYRKAPTEMLIFYPAYRSPPQNTTAVGSSSLTPVEDGGIFLIRACGLRTRSSPTPGVGLGGLVPRTESAVLGGLPFTSSDFRDFRTHGPRMRIDDLSALSGRFVARVSASVATVDRRPGLRVLSPAANAAFASVFVVPPGGDQGSAEAPAAATIVAQRAPPPTSTLQEGDPAVIIDSASSVPSLPGNPASLDILLPFFKAASPVVRADEQPPPLATRRLLLIRLRARRGP